MRGRLILNTLCRDPHHLSISSLAAVESMFCPSWTPPVRCMPLSIDQGWNLACQTKP